MLFLWEISNFLRLKLLENVALAHRRLISNARSFDRSIYSNYAKLTVVSDATVYTPSSTLCDGAM